MKFLTDIIKEQNEALRLAVATIDALISERAALNVLLAERGITDIVSAPEAISRRIKALMVLNQVAQEEIARRLKLKPSTISGVISGKRKSRRVQMCIARALHMKVSDLWPDDKKEAA